MTKPNIARGVWARAELPLAVVVGAGGIAQAVARRLGQRHRLLLADRDAEHLEKVAEMLRIEGNDVATCRCDVTSPDDVARLADAGAASRPLKALAHVVGLSPSMGNFASLMRVDLVGAALVEQAFFPLVESGAAAVFISSIAAHQRGFTDEVLALVDDPLQDEMIAKVTAALDEPATPVLAYMLAKLALNRMCRARAVAWGGRGGRINSLSPGLIASPMGAMEYKGNPIKTTFLEATPAGREGTMQEIAAVTAFLVSEDASFISGTDILVDGGLMAALASRQSRTSSEVQLK